MDKDSTSGIKLRINFIRKQLDDMDTDLLDPRTLLVSIQKVEDTLKEMRKILSRIK